MLRYNASHYLRLNVDVWASELTHVKKCVSPPRHMGHPIDGGTSSPKSPRIPPLKSFESTWVLVQKLFLLLSHP